MIRFLKKPRRHGAADAPRADARPRGGALRASFAAVLVLGLGAGVAACGGSNEGEGSSGGGGGSGETIHLVAYSTPETAYTTKLQPGFQDTPEGEGVRFQNSVGASGEQSRAVEAGLHADIVHLPLEPDITRLVDAGIISEDYKNNKFNGGLQNSVVVIGVRPGNPKNIQGWEDLIKDDVEVITPNPFTSGGARWNIMAAYGSQIAQGKSEEEALDFVHKLLEHTPVQDSSARESLQTFVNGKGDAFLSYENEALGAIDAVEELEYIVPDQTILIEAKAAVTEDADAPEAAQAFLDWMLTPDGQRAWAESGYRPVDQKVLKEYEDKYPQPKDLFTIEEFGGWEKVMTEFFDPEKGKIAEIERDLGVSTE